LVSVYHGCMGDEEVRLVLKHVQLDEELRRERKRIEIATVNATVNARLSGREVVQPNKDRLLHLTEEKKLLCAAAREQASFAESTAAKTLEVERGAMEQEANVEARGGCREETESTVKIKAELVEAQIAEAFIPPEAVNWAVDDVTGAARRLAEQTARQVIKVALGLCAKQAAKQAAEQAKAEKVAAVAKKVVAKRVAAELALKSGGAARRAAVAKALADRLAEKEGRGSEQRAPALSAHILQGAFGAASFMSRPPQRHERPHPPSRSNLHISRSPRKVKGMLKDRGRSESQAIK